MASLRRAQRESRSPDERIETALHPWVAFGVTPLFALANAGIDLRAPREHAVQVNARGVGSTAWKASPPGPNASVARVASPRSARHGT